MDHSLVQAIPPTLSTKDSQDTLGLRLHSFTRINQTEIICRKAWLVKGGIPQGSAQLCIICTNLYKGEKSVRTLFVSYTLIYNENIGIQAGTIKMRLLTDFRGQLGHTNPEDKF